jgi:RNA polymerase sigma factor (sigma-70 family)
MPLPSQSPRCLSRAETALVLRRMYDAAWAIAWAALGRFGLNREDRADLASETIWKAWADLEKYAEMGERAREQWLRRIARNAAIDFERANHRAKRPKLVLCDPPTDTATDAQSPEETAMWNERRMLVFSPQGQLAYDLLTEVPEAERRVVILRALEEASWDEIAASERCNKSTAEDRYDRGMAKLQAFAQAKEARGPLLLLAGLLASDDAGPPPEVVERQWRRFAAQVGLDLGPESEPPPSGTRRVQTSSTGEPSPSSGPPAGWASRLRALVCAAPFFGPALGRCPPAKDPPAVVTMAAAVELPAIDAIDASIVPPTMDVLLAGPSRSGYASSAPRAPHAVPAARRPGPTPAETDPEEDLMRKARAAVLAKNWPAAVRALTEHAREFPAGELVMEREGAWAPVCRAYRDGHLQDGSPALDARCAQR